MNLLDTITKLKVDQTSYHRAMREQRKIKPDFFPVDNRAARRALEAEARKGENSVSKVPHPTGREPR